MSSYRAQSHRSAIIMSKRNVLHYITHNKKERQSITSTLLTLKISWIPSKIKGILQKILESVAAFIHN
jgi:hypothetical protein